MLFKSTILAAITLASSTMATPTAATGPNKLAKRSDGTCNIAKDSQWHYQVTIPGEGHPGCGELLRDNILAMGYQPIAWAAAAGPNGECDTSFVLLPDSSTAVNQGFQTAFGGTAGC